MSYTKYDITVPEINRAYVKGTYNFTSPNVISGNIAMLKKVEADYGKFIDKWAKVFDIDRGIVICFICTESGGINAKPNRAKATGLMQATPNTVYEVMTKWSRNVKVPLTTSAKNFMNQAVSTTSKWNQNRLPTSSETSQILSALEKNPEYNIMVGTAIIRWMLEGLKEGNKTSLAKVMVAYNAGYYGTRNKMKSKTTAQLVEDKSLSLESRSYILKMVGVSGYMDLFYK